MELSNCKNCKKLFNYISGDHLCPACKEALEDKYQEVKAYIEEHPGTPAPTVAEECEVSLKQIKKWVREERLAFADDSLLGLECERCGKMIHSGRFCKECAGGLERAFTSAFHEPTAPDAPKSSSKGRMRFLDS